MRIIELRAENLKRLKAIDIIPTDDLVVLAGRNGQGKTSVLDAISWAIGGASMFKDSPDPVRHGQKQATTTVDLGEIIVTRTWTAGGTTNLTVKAKDGTKFTSPQKMLDDLIGSLSFDPLSFANMDARSQRRTLLGLVELPFDLDELDRRRQAIFDERTDANRDLKRLSNALSLLDRPTVVGEPVSTADIVATLQAATATVRSNADARHHLERLLREEASTKSDVIEAERKLAAAQHAHRTAIEAVEVQDALVDGLGPDPDVDAISAQLADAERSKDAVRLAAEYAERESQVEDAQANAVHLTALLDAIDAEKIEGLKAAKMPAPGLSISDDGVEFQGVPLSQASGAERLRVSLAIAIAANPKLRVIRIADGSLLDDDSLELVAEMAAFGDMQVWIEKVDSSGEIGIVIEDGSVVAVNEATS